MKRNKNKEYIKTCKETCFKCYYCKIFFFEILILQFYKLEYRYITQYEHLS